MAPGADDFYLKREMTTGDFIGALLGPEARPELESWFKDPTSLAWLHVGATCGTSRATCFKHWLVRLRAQESSPD
jgi:hypothetical protein